MKITDKKLLTITVLLLISTLILSACSFKNNSSAPSAAAPSAGTVDTSDQEVVSNLIMKGAGLREISYHLVTTNAGVSSESSVWFQDTKMKTDTTTNGQRMISIFNLEKGEIVSYRPGQNAAAKVNINEYKGNDNITPMDYSLALDTDENADVSYQIIGTQTLNGLECKIISVTSGQGNYKDWLSTKYGIVIKFELVQDGQTNTSEYTDIKVGAGSIPEGTFDLPKEIFIQQTP
ncbi:hypothetical protein UNSWDHB_1741 [Dehalobacter sp. UNSWDHB]|uniref:DUF4412 domain-containing protein n=1 Tax=Dehalobacter sp. UNSWDHB TaxID=1339256 RepID=UPI000387A201|nr:DUF4412 domain-containing protein [Dehalobacter sp. UNSWDHB]EQB20902.1 hypothetical protein UNSWDHB_1741 [Dehalobacter sp. UNSWDHB]